MDKSNINKFIHPDNKGREVKANKSNLEVVMGSKGENELGNKSHLESVMGQPKGADIVGHDGKM